MPQHFRRHPAGTAPAPCLIPEVTIPDDGLLRRSDHRPLQLVLDLPLQDIVARTFFAPTLALLDQLVVARVDRSLGPGLAIWAGGLGSESSSDYTIGS